MIHTTQLLLHSARASHHTGSSLSTAISSAACSYTAAGTPSKFRPYSIITTILCNNNTCTRTKADIQFRYCCFCRPITIITCIIYCFLLMAISSELASASTPNEQQQQHTCRTSKTTSATTSTRTATHTSSSKQYANHAITYCARSKLV